MEMTRGKIVEILCQLILLKNDKLFLKNSLIVLIASNLIAFDSHRFMDNSCMKSHKYPDDIGKLLL